VRARPRSAKAHAELGMVYQANGLHRPAIMCYSNAERLAPEDARWTFRRTVLLLKIGQVETAMTMLGELAVAHPLDVLIQQYYGERLLASGDWDGAAGAFQSVIEARSASAAGYHGLGEVRLRQRDYNEARRLLEKALELDPLNRGARYLLGMTLRSLGLEDDARDALAAGEGAGRSLIPRDLAQGLTRFAVNVAADLRRARDLADSGDVKRARIALQNALRRHPNEPKVLNNLAAVNIRLGRYAEAESHLKRAETLGGAAVGTYCNLAFCYLKQIRLTEALAAANHAVALAPQLVRSHMIRARVLNRMGRHTEALDALGSARECDPRDVRIHVETGRTLAQLNRFGEAADAYQRVLRMTPDDVNARLGLAAVLIRLGRLDEAAEEWEAARARRADHPGVRQLEQMLNRAKGKRPND
ncbi:MAG: tetratricopeptide repeat protein, partial [Phycisphaerae bacterium]